ncbi:MAG: PQQ-binding-like beta-propeller repeat protein [Planctomycetes bacterium]|nr:PQQ-binding-like beta-propeller repeat protein [Planctomycetota bacterium]MBL7145424.1 PQQ-binding-like beta-propeller repeat protein [Phycisphaerae bacterium]
MMKKQKQPAKTTRQVLIVLLVTFVISFSSISKGQQWSRYRGPNGQGISYAQNIPVKWTQKDYNWKIGLPGGGHSSPVLWGDKVFVTSGDQKTDYGYLLALRASDGKILWQKQYSLASYRPNPRNSYATATPALDADHVYVLWPTPQETILIALDHDGGEIWKRTFEGVYCQHGAGGSPIIFDDIVVFTHEHENSTKDAPSAWIAVDRKTGRTRWELERQTGPKTSYSTPCLYSLHTDTPQLIFTSNSHGITSVNPRKGTIIWEAESVLPARVVSSPVIAGQLLISSCGDGSRGKCLVAVNPGAMGESSRPSEAYTVDSSTAPYVPTSLANEGLLFTFHDSGYVCCLRSATGEQLWREKPAGKFFGSPVWVSGKLYCITTEGEVVVIRAASTYELLAVNPLGERSHATPAVSGDSIYLRTYSNLISIGPEK